MEKNNKLMKIFFISMTIIIVILLLIYYIFNLKSDTSNNEKITTLSIEYSNAELTGEFEEYKAKIILSDENTIIQGNGVTTNNNEITINSAGTYYITGSISDGNIVIEANKKDDVQLVLDNCSITSKSTSAINGIKCNVLTITLNENSENVVTDSSTYTKFTDTEKQEPDGTIFSKTDVVINGKGSLTVNSNYQDGIVSKDTLKIINCNINIISNDDGIRGKDYVAINSANINIKAQGAGIKSTNTDTEQLGYVLIDSGDINISSVGDSIHSKGSITINDGNINLSSEDDAIHADSNIVINNGNIDIAKSYEGIEGSYIEINGGKISVNSSDDGINVAGGSDSSSINGRPGQNNFISTVDSNRKLVINNGDITVNASGDGLDSNGSIYINGGNITVIGPTSNADAPIDFDGECVIKGGNLIAYGSSGMFESPSNSSTQNILVFRTNGNSGDNIQLKDNSGNEIVSFTTEKSYQIIIISNENLKSGETYSLYINNTETEKLEITQTVTINSSNNGFNFNNMMMDKGTNNNKGGMKGKF